MERGGQENDWMRNDQDSRTKQHALEVLTQRTEEKLGNSWRGTPEKTQSVEKGTCRWSEKGVCYRDMVDRTLVDEKIKVVPKAVQ